MLSLLSRPARVARRGEFYSQLAQLTAAGIPLLTALEHLSRRAHGADLRENATRIRSEIEAGAAFSDALATIPWIPEFDRALLDAGERSGRLDGCLLLLARLYAEGASHGRQLILGLAYPILLLHAAALLLPVQSLAASWDWTGYGLRVGILLAPFYALAAVVSCASQANLSDRWRLARERLLGWLPVVGAMQRSFALARLSLALEALINAGIPVVSAWEIAASASGSCALHWHVRNWRQQVAMGLTPAEIAAASGLFPELFLSEYAAGEISGSLDKSLSRLHQYYQDDGMRKLRALIFGVPVLIYGGVALLIVVKVLAFYSNYFKSLWDLTGGG